MGIEIGTLAAIAAATSAAAGAGTMAYTMAQGKPDIPNLNLPGQPDAPKPQAALEPRRRFQTVLSQPGSMSADNVASSGLSAGSTNKLGG
jgi:hypothetical protein